MSASVVATFLVSSTRGLSVGAPPSKQRSESGLQRHEAILGELGEQPAARRGTLSLDVHWVACDALRSRNHSVYLFMVRPPEVPRPATKVIQDL